MKRRHPPYVLFSIGNMSHISYDPYGPASAFIAKLLRKSP